MNLDNTWRHLALETIVTLSETAPAMIRKNSGHMIPKISMLFFWTYCQILNFLFIKCNLDKMFSLSVIFYEMKLCPTFNDFL